MLKGPAIKPRTPLAEFKDAKQSVAQLTLLAKRAKRKERAMTNSVYKSRPHLIPSAVVAALLFIAIVKLPYGYYQFLRFAVFGVGVYVAYVGYIGKRIWATWIFITIAVVFNPFMPIHLNRQIWAWLDVVAGVAFIIAIFLVKKKK